MPEDKPKTPDVDRAEPVYSIRIAALDESCGACRQPFSGSGPIGHRDDEPICDTCLFEGAAELGMALALISVSRTFARLDLRSLEDRQEPLRLLGIFARVYECFAAKAGPPRIFPIPEMPE